MCLLNGFTIIQMHNIDKNKHFYILKAENFYKEYKFFKHLKNISFVHDFVTDNNTVDAEHSSLI